MLSSAILICLVAPIILFCAGQSRRNGVLRAIYSCFADPAFRSFRRPRLAARLAPVLINPGIYSEPTSSPHRLRRLTLPASAGVPCANAPRVFNQDKSLLLSRLPIELRQEIYALVVGSHVVHLHRVFGERIKLRHHLCATAQTAESEISPCWGRCNRYLARPELPVLRVLPLLVTCRQIYSEAIGILYNNHVFNVWNTHPVFQHFATLTPRQRLNNVRSLQIQWSIYPSLLAKGSMFAGTALNAKEDYDRFWAIITSMRGLRFLRVWLHHSRMDKETWHNEEDLWLAPVRKVTAPSLFELALPVVPAWVQADSGKAKLVEDGMQIGHTVEQI